MMYLWIGLGLAVIVALTALLRAWNSGKIAEETTEQAKAKADRAEAIQKEKTNRAKVKADARAAKQKAKADRRVK